MQDYPLKCTIMEPLVGSYTSIEFLWITLLEGPSVFQWDHFLKIWERRYLWMFWKLWKDWYARQRCHAGYDSPKWTFASQQLEIEPNLEKYFNPFSTGCMLQSRRICTNRMGKTRNAAWKIQRKGRRYYFWILRLWYVGVTNRMLCLLEAYKQYAGWYCRNRPFRPPRESIVQLDNTVTWCG